MTSARKWFPAPWMDEIVGKTGDSPNDFIWRNALGVLELYPLDPIEGEIDGRVRTIEDGEVVEFFWTESYGEGTLKVLSDGGGWTCDQEFPDTATYFWLPYDVDTLSVSLDEFVNGNDWCEALSPGEYTVGAYTWSDPIKFRLQALESGAAEFVEVQP